VDTRYLFSLLSYSRKNRKKANHNITNKALVTVVTICYDDVAKVVRTVMDNIQAKLC